MPLDTSEFDKRIAESRYSVQSYDGKRTNTGQGEATLQVAMEIVKTVFPDLIAKTHSKVSAKEPRTPGATGEYSYSLAGGEGDGIRLKNADRIYPAMRRVDAKPGTDAKSYSEVNFTTDQVMEGVNTVLHEMYHARTRAGFINEGAATSKLTPEQMKRVNDMAQAPESGYPQFGSPFASMFSDTMNEEEFMANADALLSMKERGLRVSPESRTAGRMVTLQRIMQEIPEVAAYIESRRQPNIPSLKAPPTGTLGAIISNIDAFLNDYSVKETSGGAKPGTPRATGK